MQDIELQKREIERCLREIETDFDYLCTKYDANELFEKFSAHIDEGKKELAEIFAYCQKERKLGDDDGRYYLDRAESYISQIHRFEEDGKKYFSVQYVNKEDPRKVVTELYSKDENGRLVEQNEIRDENTFVAPYEGLEGEPDVLSFEEIKESFKKELIQERENFDNEKSTQNEPKTNSERRKKDSVIFEKEITKRTQGKEEKNNIDNVDFYKLMVSNVNKDGISEKISRYLEGDQKEMAELFAHCQKERISKYNDYDIGEEVVNIQRIQKNIDSEGKEYYEVIIPNEEDRNKIIIETYTRDENGQFKKNDEYESSPTYAYEGKNGSKNVFSSQDAETRLKKSLIEDKMKNGRVTEIAEITDKTFLSEFAKQIGQDGGLYNATIISTVNEKGEEDYDIVFADYSTNRIFSMPGINSIETDKTEISVDTGASYPMPDGSIGGKIGEYQKILKSFETQDGHRYSITRGRDGKLAFNEIYRETEQLAKAQAVNTKSLDDLKETYKSAKINNTDLSGAYNRINRTKEQQQDQTKNQENGVR